MFFFSFFYTGRLRCSYLVSPYIILNVIARVQLYSNAEYIGNEKIQSKEKENKKTEKEYSNKTDCD